MSAIDRRLFFVRRSNTRQNANGNWQGGRIVTPDGYVMIRVGRKHHLSDCRGYAYEHRMVAECNLGRRLAPGEEVHHRDESDRQNNDWSNLTVCANRLEHQLHHRTSSLPSRAAQLPGEENVEIECGCGCGGRFPKYDSVRRARRFLPSHNSIRKARADG